MAKQNVSDVQIETTTKCKLLNDISTNKNVESVLQKIDCSYKVIPKGLQNLGNTCFFNSVLQCLINTHPVSLYLNYLKNLKFVKNSFQYLTKINETSVEIPIVKISLPDCPMPLFSTFSLFFQDYCKNRLPTPHSLFNQVCQKSPRFRGFAQQDAHELLRYLLDGLRQEELDRFKKAFFQHVGDQTQTLETKEKLILQYKGFVEGAARPILDSVFGGVLQQSIKCLNCGYIFIRYEPFLDLSLSVLKPNVANDTVQFSKKKKNRLEQVIDCSSLIQKDHNNLSKHMKKKELKNKKKLRKQNLKARNKTNNLCSNGEIFFSNEAFSKNIKNETVDDDNIYCNNIVEEEKLKNKIESDDICSSKQNFVNDDIVELIELAQADYESFDFSVLNSLRLFTMPEILSGVNAYICEKCCVSVKKKNDNVRTEKKLNVEASMRYLISKPPLILTLHLKRFEQIYTKAKMPVKKFRGFVEFGLTLDLAPFCCKSVKRIGDNQKQILYSLYGVVCHSGDLSGGHYFAYIRARPQMESCIQNLFDECLVFEPDFLTDIITYKCSNLSLSDSNNNNNEKLTIETSCSKTERITKNESQEILKILKENSKWYYISDSQVSLVSESKVISSEAFILFYERIY